MRTYLRPCQLAEKLNVSERLIREWQSKRIIPFTKIGRVILFDPAKVEAALAEFERRAVA